MFEHGVKDILFVVKTDEEIVSRLIKVEKSLRRAKVLATVAIGVAVAVEIQLSILEAKLEDSKTKSKD